MCGGKKPLTINILRSLIIETFIFKSEITFLADIFKMVGITGGSLGILW